MEIASIDQTGMQANVMKCRFPPGVYMQAGSRQIRTGICMLQRQQSRRLRMGIGSSANLHLTGTGLTQ